MDIDKELVAPTLENVALVNLDLDPDERRQAIAEAARHLEELAKLPPLSKGASEVMRMVDGMRAPWGDLRAWRTLMAEGLRAKAQAS